jgi:ubiquitin C-terminal hydrolase
MLGIRENVWSFTTKEKKETFAPSTTGILRLTSNGTQVFDKLSQDDRNHFFNTLLDDLSLSVPINNSRLIIKRITQLDNSVYEKQYLISITIKAGSNNYVNSVVSIIDTIIKHKGRGPIAFSQVAGYLDESYGFKQLREYLLIKNKFIIYAY